MQAPEGTPEAKTVTRAARGVKGVAAAGPAAAPASGQPAGARV